MARYVNLSDLGAATGNSGTSPEQYWNLADVQGGATEDNAGETIYIKGYATSTASFTKFRTPVAIEPWGESNAFGFSVFDDAALPIEGASLKVARGIFNQRHLNAISEFDTCIIAGQTTGGGVYVNNLGGDTSSADIIKLVNCTFGLNTSQSSTKTINLDSTQVHDGLSGEYEFTSCLIIKPTFTHETSAEPKKFTFTNCLFTEITEAQLRIELEVSGNTVTVDNCTFDPAQFYTYSDINSLLSSTGKNTFEYPRFIDEYGVDGTGDESLYTGVDSIFGGIQKCRGAFWTAISYKVDLTKSTTSGDGIVEPIGVVDMHNFCNNGNAINGRYYREGDGFELSGEQTESSGPIRLYSSGYNSIEYFSPEFSTSSYAYCAITGPTSTPLILDEDISSIEIGSHCRFNNAILNISNITGEFNWFNSSILFNSNEISLTHPGGSGPNSSTFSFSTIITPTIRFNGVIDALGVAIESTFYKCLLHGYSDGEIQFISDVDSQEKTSSNYVSGEQLISGGQITFGNRIVFDGSVDMADDTSGSTFNGEVYFNRSTAADEIRMHGVTNYNGVVYCNNDYVVEQSVATPADDTSFFNSYVGVDTQGDMLNFGGLSNIEMDFDTYFNGTLSGQIADLNGQNFWHSGSVPDAASRVTNYGSIVDTGSTIDIHSEIGTDAKYLTRTTFNINALDASKILVWGIDVVGNQSIPAPTSGEITGEYIDDVWSYANSNNKLWNGYVLIEFGQTETVAFSQDGDAMENKVIFINRGYIQDQALGGVGGWYDHGSEAMTIMYNAPTGTLEYVVSQDGTYPGYMRNEGTLVLGSVSKGFGAFSGVLHDMSNNTTVWNVVEPCSVDYSSTTADEIISLGLIDSNSWYGDATVSLSLIWGKTNSTEEQLFGDQVTEGKITITGPPVDYDILLNNSFPTEFEYYSYKNRLIFSDYDNNGNLTAPDPDAGELGLWESPMGDNDVGGFYFGSATLSRDYYVDISSTATGLGTEVSPLSYSQFKDYLSASGLYFPVSGDNLYIRGRVVDSNSELLNMRIGEDKSIVLQAWDLDLYGQWVIEASNINSTIFNVDGDDNALNAISIYDLAVVAPNPSSYVIVASATDLDSTIIISNSTITSNRSLGFFNEYNVNSGGSIIYRCCTLVSSTYMVMSTGDSDVVMTDSVFSCGGTLNDNALASNQQVLKSELNISDISGLTNITSTDNTFDNATLNSMRSNLSASTYDKIYFIFALYAITNDGSGSVTWDAWGISYGVGGLLRTGIGAMWFSDAERDYYFDLDNSTSGEGTEDSPFNYAQLQNYFDNTAGTAINIIPFDGDILNVRGVYKPSVEEEFIKFGQTLNGSVKVESWNQSLYGPWIVDLSEYRGGNSFNFISSPDGYYYDNLSIAGFVLLNNGAVNNVNMCNTEILWGGETSFKVCIVYSEASGNLVLSTEDFHTTNYYGCTINGDNLYYKNNTSTYDTTIKASSIDILEV